MLRFQLFTYQYKNLQSLFSKAFKSISKAKHSTIASKYFYLKIKSSLCSIQINSHLFILENL